MERYKLCCSWNHGMPDPEPIWLADFEDSGVCLAGVCVFGCLACALQREVRWRVFCNFVWLPHWLQVTASIAGQPPPSANNGTIEATNVDAVVVIAGGNDYLLVSCCSFTSRMQVLMLIITFYLCNADHLRSFLLPLRYWPSWSKALQASMHLTWSVHWMEQMAG